MFGKAKPQAAIKLNQLSSLVAADVEIDGDLVFVRGLRIDGRVRGRVTGLAGDAGTPALLVLSSSGRIEGSVYCGNALIGGCIQGDIEIEQFVELQAGARIIGTLRYRRLQMELGAVVQGQLVCIADAEAAGQVVEIGAPGLPLGDGVRLPIS
ncbi:Cell shape determination protein CcmA [Rubrivivax sp. A210]|uniref:bactofilin family protein n=1 Tax=Rubrivivax sp. A210 TaxID=2772301 RepID=UPI00191AE4DA|nr:polymer-forming cytoskeletal protein [Rubrivivax sp. A210]CAD5375174.1 Cell shape determination protein CcmA [Rubrivivax sp. A210]